ncbi:MAG: extracellular solute-binding protein [Desulfobacterales bacterium]|nr:extracellular solute-binding protein [Desulfobacterales bacterium]
MVTKFVSYEKIIVVCLALAFSILILPHSALAKEKPGFVLLIRMMSMQDRWFREKIVAPFEKKHGARVTVASFDRFWDLEVMLKLERDSGRHSIGLVKVPLEMTRPLAEFMTPYDELMSKEELQQVKSRYDPRAVELATIDGRLYYLPRKLETRMMIYMKSKAAEAVRGWKQFEKRINAALKEDNGYGLPAGYRLEPDPNLWDYYDLFVASFYWAHTPYYGIKMPRMAHRGKKYAGTVVGLVDRIYQMGGTAKDVLKMSAGPVVDMFVWESIYRKNGLYNQGMWQDPWSGGGIWNAMKDGKVFLAMMHQIDSFFIHGGSHPHMQGYLVAPDDMGAAVMPKGESFELDREGRPLSTAGKKAGTAGWWWGIPKSAPYPQLSAGLAKWITNYDNHLAECKVFGMMPIRKDILADLKNAFPKGWMADVFDVSTRQIKLNGDATMPLLPEYSDVGKIYLSAWYDIVVGGNYGHGGRVQRDYIEQRLETIYVPKIKEVVGDKYPNPDKPEQNKDG